MDTMRGILDPNPNLNTLTACYPAIWLIATHGTGIELTLLWHFGSSRMDLKIDMAACGHLHARLFL